ncbi:hypothetical protein TcasGA2_TC007240 [Tribolium castaneum]|uniref:Uncharacterized protein n=1 Tax=Tribolium castaneum TaxID=7070 RepID=D2A0L4_TRICA|nr:hypothetical protein TcasGA2_TC007240 [Tribolium castaneum]
MMPMMAQANIGCGSPEAIGCDFARGSGDDDWSSPRPMDGSPMSTDPNGAPTVGDDSEPVSKTQPVTEDESVTESGPGDHCGGHRSGQNGPMSAPAAMAQPQAQAVAHGADGPVPGDDARGTRHYGADVARRGGVGHPQDGESCNDLKRRWHFLYLSAYQSVHVFVC